MTQMITAEDMALLETLKGLREIGSGRLSGFKHDSPGAPITTGFSHGSGGLFSLAGPNPRVWSTITGTKSLGTQLPSFASVDTNPLRSVLTGVTAVTGENKSTICGDAPVAGLRKTGAFSHTFGSLELATKEIHINRLGQRTNRSEPMDLYLQNQPDLGTPPIAPTFGANPAFGNLNSEIAGKLIELQMGFVHLLAGQVWTGDPANNTGTYPNLIYGEFNGLQILVNTGYQDAVSGQAVPSVDSDVKDFGNAQVESNGAALVNYLTYMLRYLGWRADTSGVGNVEWAYVMRPSAFWEITDIWPCAYNTYRCANNLNSATDRQFVDAASQRRFSDDMRNGRYLLVDGQQIPVILDAYLPETQPVGGVFESDIYLIPLRVGGVPTLYWEHFDEGNADISAFLATVPGEAIKVSDGGAYIIWSKRTNLCYQLQAKTQERLILETPWLAGRLNNVRYVPLQHEIEPDPAAGYHLNGGLTYRSGPSHYAITSA